MIKRKKIFLFLLIFISGCGKNSTPKEREKIRFFYEIPIVKYAESDAPCVPIQIEDKEIIGELAIGSNGYVSVSPTCLEKIEKKEYSRRSLTYSVKGESYWHNVFSIEQLDIGPACFSGKIYIDDGNGLEFKKDAKLCSTSEPSSLEADARLGWYLFTTSNLLLDTQNSKIIFCDSLETAEEHGYFLTPFCRAPLLLDRGYIEFNAKTSMGELRCMLHTGSNYNIINRDVEQFSLKNPEICSSFCIGSQDLGPVTFYPFSLKLPIQLESILGMDFFFKHVVFIDFQKEEIYIYPYSNNTSIEISTNQENIKPPFFHEVPIAKYDKSDSPCVDIQIEDKTFTAMLDLGSNAYLSMAPPCLEKIEKKDYSHRRLTYGIKGKGYWQNVFSIERLKMGDFFLSGKVQVNDGYGLGLSKDATVYSSRESVHSETEACLGWPLFEECNLLLDMKQSKIIFCDSLETAQKHGYFLKNFCETPLLLDRGIIELKAKTDAGELRCILDTGATVNVIDREVKQFSFDVFEEYPSFFIDSKNLGPFTFYHYPIQLPINVDAILGMDFFFDHIVFIDFKREKIFICPYRSLGE